MKTIDVHGRKHILVPLHLFEDIHPECNKYLLSIFEDGVAEEDGCHDDAQGVAGAKVLIERLGLQKNRGERKTVMITIEEVPEFKGKHNEEAIATLAPAVEAYNKKTRRNRKKGID